MRRFEGRVALVTGGSRGIGFAIAKRLVDEGASVVITGRKQESLDAALSELGGAGSALAGKADDAEHRAAVYDHIAQRHGRLDHLVNNAGDQPGVRPAGRYRCRGGPEDPRSQRDRNARVVARRSASRAERVDRESVVGVGAGPVAFLLSDDASWITGQTIAIDGGMGIRPAL